MGKHLSIDEKINAPKELAENRAKIKDLRDTRRGLKYLVDTSFEKRLNMDFEAEIKKISQEIGSINSRNARLKNFIHGSSTSPYNGMHAKEGICYKMFGKKRSELTSKEQTKYNKVMKAKEREERYGRKTNSKAKGE